MQGDNGRYQWLLWVLAYMSMGSVAAWGADDPKVGIAVIGFLVTSEGAWLVYAKPWQLHSKPGVFLGVVSRSTALGLAYMLHGIQRPESYGVLALVIALLSASTRMASNRAAKSPCGCSMVECENGYLAWGLVLYLLILPTGSQLRSIALSGIACLAMACMQACSAYFEFRTRDAVNASSQVSPVQDGRSRFLRLLATPNVGVGAMMVTVHACLLVFLKIS